jgi:serine/threonine protein kinase
MVAYSISFIKQSKYLEIYCNCSRKEFKMKDLLRFCQETASAILFLHQSKIVHRDIKTLNILLDQRNSIKLCDFGLARHQVIIL